MDPTANFRHYIAKGHQFTAHVDPDLHFRAFDTFLDACLAYVPRDGTPPVDPYGFNGHMGAFARALNTAADEFVAALTCYHRQTGNAAPPSQ